MFRKVKNYFLPNYAADTFLSNGYVRSLRFIKPFYYSF